MKILAIDYGIRKIGLAVGDSELKLAEPFKVLRVKTKDQAIKLLEKDIEKIKPDMIVMGLSENEMAQTTRQFGNLLSKRINLPLIYQNETLSSYDANKYTIASGVKRKKRKSLEDAYAAAVIMQNYFESNS
jgi:putative holliday junction resolvase